MSDLSSLDIGIKYSSSGKLQDTIRDILNRRLKEALDDTGPLFTAINNAWVGEDCDKYLENIKTIIDNCKQAIDVPVNNLIAEIDEIEQLMRDTVRKNML